MTFLGWQEWAAPTLDHVPLISSRQTPPLMPCANLWNHMQQTSMRCSQTSGPWAVPGIQVQKVLVTDEGVTTVHACFRLLTNRVYIPSSEYHMLLEGREIMSFKSQKNNQDLGAQRTILEVESAETSTEALRPLNPRRNSNQKQKVA